MRATVPIPQLIRASSHFKEDGLLVVQGQHCLLRFLRDGVYLETLLQARDIEPGEMVIPRRSLKALSFLDEPEVTFSENEQSWGYVTSLGTFCTRKGSARPSAPHAAALASPLLDINASQPGWVLPTRPFRRALRILQRLGSIQVLHGMMVARGAHESIIVRSASFDSLPFGIVAPAVDPLINLLKSGTEVAVKTGAKMSVVQGGDVALGWFTSSEKPINLHPLPSACTVRVLRHDFEKRLRIANRGTATLRCKPEEAVLSLEKEGLRSLLKIKVVSGAAVSVQIDPMALYAHVSALKGAEIEIAVGP